MGATTTVTSGSKAVGSELASVLPQDNKRWWQRGHLIKLNFVILSLVQFASTNGYDGSIMNGLQALELWTSFMESPTGAWLGFINGIYWLGAFIVAPFAAMIANRFGRKPVIYLGYCFLIPGVVLQSAAHNDIAFVMARLLLGMCSGLFSCGVPLLISEIAYPTHRGVASALYNTGWYVGAIVAAFATFGTRNMPNNWCWRIPSLLQILLPILALPGLIMAPESPRWLTDVSKNGQARKMLTNFHAGGDADAALVNYEMLEIETTIQAEKAAKDSSSYADMYRTKGNRWRLLITISLAIFSQWSGNGVISYYLALVLDTVGIKDTSDQLMIAAGMQIWNLFFAVGAAVCVDRLGRRFLFLTSAMTMLVSYIVVTGLSGSFAQSGSPSVGVAVIPFLFIFFAGYDIALTPLLVSYTCEIWPYSLRSRGITVTWLVAILAIFFNTFINPIALEALAWKYYIVFIVVLIVMNITVYFFYPETRGYSLEQMSHIFDGEDAAAPQPFETKERALSVSHAEETGGRGEKGMSVGAEEKV